MVEQSNYLSTAGVGLIPKSVQEAVREFSSESLRTPPYPDLFEERLEMVESARQVYGKLINAPAETVSFQPNSSFGTSATMEVIEFRRGDNVVVDDLHFLSEIYQLKRIEQQGVELRWVKNKDGAVDASQYDEVVDGDTRLVSTSYVSWLNGFRSPVEEIGKIAKRNDAYFFVDATQGAGYLEIDVEKWQCDFLVSSNYKWMLSDFGVAEFYMRKNLLENFESPHIGWFSVEDRHVRVLDEYRPATTARKFEPGNPSYSAIFCLTKSLEFLEETGIGKIRERTLGLAGRLIEGLDQMGATVHTPTDTDRHSAILFCSFNGYDGLQVSKELKREKIYVSARDFNKTSGLRVSPYFYNTENDVEQFLKAVSKFSK